MFEVQREECIYRDEVKSHFRIFHIDVGSVEAKRVGTGPRDSMFSDKC